MDGAKEHLKVMAERALAVLKRKNQDYSGGGGPFDNFKVARAFGVHPVQGLLLRMTDKFKRVQSFVVNGRMAVAEEGLLDAIEDNYNYMILLVGMVTPEVTTREQLIALHDLITGEALRLQGHDEISDIVSEFGDRRIFLIQTLGCYCVSIGAVASSPGFDSSHQNLLRNLACRFLLTLASLRALAVTTTAAAVPTPPPAPPASAPASVI